MWFFTHKKGGKGGTELTDIDRELSLHSRQLKAKKKQLEILLEDMETQREIDDIQDDINDMNAPNEVDNPLSAFGPYAPIIAMIMGGQGLGQGVIPPNSPAAHSPIDAPIGQNLDLAGFISAVNKTPEPVLKVAIPQILNAKNVSREDVKNALKKLDGVI